MAVGVGGLVMNLMGGDSSAQLGQALAGPRPNPQAGGAPSPTDGQGTPSAGAPAQQPQMAPAPGYAPDPVNASAIQQLFKIYQNEATANDINRNIALIGSGFGTAQQQHDKLAAVAGMPQGGGDVLGAIGQAQKIQQQQLVTEQASRFAAGAQTLLQTLGYSKDQAATIGSNPELTQKLVAQDFVNKSPTEQEKLLNRYRSDLQAEGKSPAEITQLETGLLGGMVSPQDTMTKEFNSAWNVARQRNPGKSDAQILSENPTLESPLTYSGAVTEKGKQAGIAATDKINAVSSFHTILPTLQQANDNLQWLKDHPDATVAAVHTPGLYASASGLASAVTGQTLPGANQDALQARSRIDWLKKNLFADKFAGTKNVRSNTEANNLGAAASNVDSIKNSPQQITDEINRLYGNSGTAIANLHAMSGKTVPSQYAGLADPTYFDKNSPLYNYDANTPHEEETAQPVTISGPQDISKLGHGQAFIIPDGPNKGKIGYAP